MADIDDIMDDIAKELADPNSALNAEMQGKTPENFNLQQELNSIGQEIEQMRNAPQAPNPNAPALYENVPVAQAPYSLSVGRMGLGGPTVSGQQGLAQQAYSAVAKTGLNPNTYAGVVAQAAYTQVAEETLDPEAAAAAAEAVAAQVAQGQGPNTAAAVDAGRGAAAANYSNTYAADMEALAAQRAAPVQGVSLPEPNPSPRTTFGPEKSNVLNSPNPPVNFNLLNPYYANPGVGRFSAPVNFANIATPAYSNVEDPPTVPANFNFTGVPATVPGIQFGKTSPELDPNIGLTPAQAFGVMGFDPTPSVNSAFDLTGPSVDFGFTDIGATAPDYTQPNMAPSRSFMAPQISFDPDELSFGTPAAQNAIDKAMSEYGLSVPPTPARNPAATYEAVAQELQGLGLQGLDPAAPPTPARNPAATYEAVAQELQGLGLQGLDPAAAVQKNQINAMIDLENQLAAQAYGRTAPTSGRSGRSTSSSRSSTSSRSGRGSPGGRGPGSPGGRGPGSPGGRTSSTSTPSWTEDGQVTFSQEAADPSDPGPACYIATDAVSAGAFSKLDKAKAELWCKRALHNHWAGETVRLGYQALSKRAVANGTASKHYDEFQRFVRYGRGLDKTLKGAVTFYTRMAQFFAVGLINRLKAR
ncbi:MAG: hypothetical protein ACPHA6_13770 [Paracoccaceae bacterium]